MRRWSVNRGFTLLELMVVMTLMGMILAFSAPRLAGSFGSVTLNTAAADVAAVFRYARNQAVITKKKIVCEIDAEQGKITVNPLLSETETAVNPTFAKEYTLPSGIEFSSLLTVRGRDLALPAQIVFYPSGSSGGGQLLIVDKERERRYRCSVNFITGTVKLDEE